jgi:hypothetical protein
MLEKVTLVLLHAGGGHSFIRELVPPIGRHVKLRNLNEAAKRRKDPASIGGTKVVNGIVRRRCTSGLIIWDAKLSLVPEKFSDG